MKKNNCYKAQRGLDDVIASQVDGWTSEEVANLRGMWEEQNPDHSITTDDVETLVEFKKNLSESDAKRLIEAMKGSQKVVDALVYKQLRNAFDAEERFNRISMISTIFTDVIDAAQEANPNMSRKDIIEKGGVSNIFANVYESLQMQYSEAIEEGDTETAAKYQKVFDNWDALVYASKIRIKAIEDVKLGQDIDFADTANPDNYNDNNMSDKFIMDESKREGWMEQSEFLAAFGSIGKQVRKVIGRLPQFDKNGVKLDDLGFPVMQDPVRVHQELLDVLRGMSTESQMIELLRQYSSTVSWVNSLLEELENPEVRTQFFVDFKKNFQPYSMQTESKDGKISSYKTAILNKIKGDKPFSSFISSVKLGKIVNPTKSIFENVGVGATRVMPVRLERIRNRIINTLQQDGPFGKAEFWSMSRVSKKEFLIDATESLNMNIDGDTIDRLLARPKDLRGFTKSLYEAAQFGLNLTNEEQEGKKTISYEELIKKASSNEKKGVLREKITKMLAITTKYNEGLRLDSRVRFGENTMYSNVTPSFMGDRMDLFSTFSKTANQEGLKTFIDENYLNSSYFFRDGKILNKWLSELYNSDLTKDDNFCANFQYKRGLALGDLEFEDFTAKQHLLYLMNEYFSERQISAKSQYAWYPVFILGDSGVAKFIKAKRYSYNEIVDGLYDTYIQERRRMELTKAVNSKLKEDGFKPIDNFSRNGNKFSLLTFLNEEQYANMVNENNLEESVKSAIDSYLRNGISDFKDKVNRLGLLSKVGNQYQYLSQEVKNDESLDKVLADYYCNTKFATIQQLQMMTIDPSFYAGTKDLQKRYKEIHAPGNSLSVEAIDPWTGKRYSDGIERVVYFDDINVNAEKVDPEFMKVIASHFGKNSNTYKAYLKNTLTDGQGYRTLESYRKVMGMSGKWTADMQNAYEQIQDIRSRIGNENITPEDIKALSDLAVVFQPIKPYMFTFENYSVGSDMLKIPVQHKYAEAVLIPELLPAGSKLRDMANWMEDSNIDMVGSTKIVKVGGFGATDIANVTNSVDLRNALDNGYIHQLSYADYRIQTNVPEHVNSSQLFGTQVRKLIMAKIKAAKDYSNYVGGKTVNLGEREGRVKLNGINLVRFYNSLITANILDSYNKFERAASNTDNISNRLIQTTANNDRESKDNILSYALNEFGEFTVPLFEGALEHDSSALMFSLFKKMVNKQAIKGGSAVQVSAMGITGYEESGDLRYVTDNSNNILYAECEMPWDLTYTDVAGNTQSLEFNDWCNPDGTLKTDKNGNPYIEKVYPNILSMIAYRIPTERDYSMINLRIKRFSHKTAGGTIKVPAQGTTIAGFDFDIDKLYLMLNEFRMRDLSKEEVAEAWNDFYESNDGIREALKGARASVSAAIKEGKDEESFDRLYKYWDKAGLPYSYQEAFQQFLIDHKDKYKLLDTYDFDKSPLQNSRASRNNMLINLIQQRLMDEETFKDRYTPGGFANASKAARLMRQLLFGSGDIGYDMRNGTVTVDKMASLIEEGKLEDPEPNYDPSDPMTIITYNQQNQVAGKLIGIFANQNTNHAFASLMKKFELKKPISFAGKSYRDLLNSPNGVDTSLSVAELLAASVDAVKDPVLNYLNLNTITADAGAMLARLGYTMEDIGLLFNQPIIKDICEYSFNNGMSDINSVIQNVLDDMYELSGDEWKANPNVEFSRERLAYNIVENVEVPRDEMTADELENFKQRQRHIAALFKEIIEASNDVGNFVRNTKFTASNAVGSTFGDAIAQQMKVANYIESLTTNDKLKVDIVVGDGIYTPINNDDVLELSNSEYLDHTMANPFSYEQAMYDMNRKAFNLMSKYFPYANKAYREGRNTLASLTKSKLLDAKTINSIHSDMLVYMLSNQENSLFNGKSIVHTDLGPISSRDYFTKVVPKDVFDILEANPTLKSLPIFKYMQFQTDEKTGEISMNIQDIGGLAPYQKDEIKESWAELAKNESTAYLAQDLFMYNFYKLGFVFSAQSFMNLAPTELKERIVVGKDYDGNPRSYVDFLDDVKHNRIGFNSTEFAKQYILNHLDNNRLVFEPKGKSAKIINSLVYNGDMVNSSFILDSKKWGKDANVFLLDSEKGTTAFRPAIIVGDDVYMCDSGRLDFNTSETGAITYYRVDKLGTNGMSLQYTSNVAVAEVDRKIAHKKTEGNTSVEPEVVSVTDGTPNVEELIQEALELYQQIEPEADVSMALKVLRNAANENMNNFKAFIEELKTKVNSLRDAENKPLC